MLELCTVARVLRSDDRKGEVLFTAVECCDAYEVLVVAFSDARLLARLVFYGDLSEGEEREVLCSMPLERCELEQITCLDLSENAIFLAVACEALVVVLPLLELLLAEAPPHLAECLRDSLRDAEKINRHEDAVKGSFSIATAWTSLGLSGEILTDFFGGSSGGMPSSTPLRFPVPAIQEDGAGITSMCWWTHGAIPPDTVSSRSPRWRRHCLIFGSLSGRLVIMDISSQSELRTFSLSPIVLLQLCRYHSQEWLLIETTAEPKHWKLLLVEDRPDQPALQWNITNGQALPSGSGEHFEMEPLNGTPPHLLLVVRRGLKPEGKSEVLGMLMDEDAQGSSGLCLLLSLPSFPEDPLARVELPMDVAAPSSSGKRRLVDLVVLLGGGLFLTVLHEGSDSLVMLTTAKPSPAFAQQKPVNQVVQELLVPGRVLGASAHQYWSPELRCGGRSLAILWTATEIFALTALGKSLVETLQSRSIDSARASVGMEPSAEWDELLPLLCWALDVDIDNLLLDAGRRVLSGRWDQIGEQGLRSALALWERRSSQEVPLLVLQECFSELSQHLEMMHHMAPGILHVLMPHWPRVALRLEAMHSRGASTEFDAEKLEEDIPGSPELSNVAWFLSLVVMLLVVLRQKAQNEGATGEYKRGAKSPNVHSLKDGIAWQAWVSDQVTLIISGARGPPAPSFADFADAVQQEFDLWWAQELQEAQSPQDLFKPENILASTLTPEPAKKYGTIYQRSMGIDPELVPGCCSARLLLLGLLKKRWPQVLPESGRSQDSNAEFEGFAQWLVSLDRLGVTLAAGSLVELLLRGAVATSEGPEEAKEIAADVDLALAVAFAMMDVQTSFGNRTVSVCGALSALLKLARLSERPEPSIWSEDPKEESPHVEISAPELLDRLCNDATEERNSSQSWMNLLDCISELPGSRCSECSNTWSWEQEGRMTSFAALQPTGGLGMTQVLQPLESWLMKSCSLLDEPPTSESESTSCSSSALLPTTEMRETLQILEDGAQWEVPHTFADRLVQCQWWHEVQRPRWSPALPLLMLALLAAVEEWIWELPWTAKFRIHLAYAVYIVRSWAEKGDPDKNQQGEELAATASFSA